MTTPLIPAFALKRLAPATKLKACVLWPGSALELEFRFGGITYYRLVEEYNKKSKLDDRTPNEDEWLKAITETLQEGGFEPIIK